MLEAFTVHTSKSVVLEKVIEFSSLKPENIIALGDSYNNLDMFQIAGKAVAIGNAPEKIKEEAHIIIGSNESEEHCIFS